MGTDIHGPWIEREYVGEPPHTPASQIKRWESIAEFDWGRDYLLFDLLCGARHGPYPETPDLPPIDQETWGYQQQHWHRQYRQIGRLIRELHPSEFDHLRGDEDDCWGHLAVTPDQLWSLIQAYERIAADDKYQKTPEEVVYHALATARIAERDGRTVRIAFCFDN